jgi:hypothetical protein
VRAKFESLRTAEIQLARNVETEKEHIDQFDKRKQAQCLEWRAIFAQFYDRGRRNGAVRETQWSVLRKSFLGSLCALPLAFLVPLAWLPAMLAIPALALFVYFNHRRHHPSHERYLAQENTHFAVIPDAPQLREIPAPQQRLLTKGDNSNDRES